MKRWYIIFVAVLGLLPLRGQAAILYTTPETQVVPVNGLAVVDVRLNSEKVIVNAVEARLTYNPAVLDVLAVSKAGTFLSLWTQEPKVDAEAGLITFSGGTPHGSYVINGRLLSIVVRPKHIGVSTIGIDPQKSGVYVNDGVGTKTSLTVKNGILDAKAFVTALSISSASHPDENVWYRSPSASFSWNATAGAYYAFLLYEDPTAIPDTRFGQQTAEATYSDLGDGVHYFTLVERLPNDAWGTVLRRRVMVDTTPPELFTPKLTSDVVAGKRVLVFAATDATSQVVRWRVKEGNSVTDNAASPYVLQDPKQRAALSISAFDAAGNERNVALPGSGLAPDRQSYTPIITVGIILIVLCGSAVFVVRRRK